MGRGYHVFNRVGGDSQIFDAEELACTFEALRREVVQRDEVAVLAWCLLGNRYHLVLTLGGAPLSRTLKSLQKGVTSAGPGKLPWWRLGRPTEDDRLRRRRDAFIDEQG